uniref:DnaJ heat shock protein family (Hsp40) member C6 n=1 Tax=Ornithorhynchus anatinus TaxID=9258 RepID=A0A6I8NFK7_ORNAN
MDSSGASSPDVESNSGGGLLDMVKGGAGRLFSNLKDNLKDTIKDTSSKVMQSVASYAKGEPDVSYVTSRIIVMSFPAEGAELGFRNQIEDVRTFLDSRHPDRYTVFNLSPKSYRGAKFHNRVSECSWPARQAPSLHNLYAVCKNMQNWLQQNPKNVCVIHCLDGCAASAVLVGAMFCFCHLFSGPAPALRLLDAKRPGIALWPSHRRYLGYICDLVADRPVHPHCKPLTVKSITLSPVPCFNKQRNGCRPFCDVLVGETKIFTTSLDYERTREFRVQEGKVVLPLGVTAHGDVVVSVYHTRSTIGGRLQAKVTNTQMLQIQFHSGFVPPGTTVMKFTKPELDACDSPEKYPQLFHVLLEVEIEPGERQTDLTPPWENFSAKDVDPGILFSSHREQRDALASGDQRADKTGGRSGSEEREALVHQESEQSDDELLSLSGRRSDAGADRPRGTPGRGERPREPPAPAPPPPPPPPEEVDLLGLAGSPVSKGFPGPAPAAPRPTRPCCATCSGAARPGRAAPGGGRPRTTCSGPAAPPRPAPPRGARRPPRPRPPGRQKPLPSTRSGIPSPRGQTCWAPSWGLPMPPATLSFRRSGVPRRRSAATPSTWAVSGRAAGQLPRAPPAPYTAPRPTGPNRRRRTPSPTWGPSGPTWQGARRRPPASPPRPRGWEGASPRPALPRSPRPSRRAAGGDRGPATPGRGPRPDRGPARLAPRPGTGPTTTSASPPHPAAPVTEGREGPVWVSRSPGRSTAAAGRSGRRRWILAGGGGRVCVCVSCVSVRALGAGEGRVAGRRCPRVVGVAGGRSEERAFVCFGGCAGGCRYACAAGGGGGGKDVWVSWGSCTCTVGAPGGGGAGDTRARVLGAARARWGPRVGGWGRRAGNPVRRG